MLDPSLVNLCNNLTVKSMDNNGLDGESEYELLLSLREMITSYCKLIKEDLDERLKNIEDTDEDEDSGSSIPLN